MNCDLEIDASDRLAKSGPRGVDRAAVMVEATLRLLGQSGLEGLNVRAVLKEAGINRRVFYEHFSGKDDLVLAVFAKSVQLTADACRSEMTGIVSPVERLRCVIFRLAVGDPRPGEDWGPALRRGAALCREHLRLAEARPERLHAALEPVLELMAQTIADGIAEGIIRAGSPGRLSKLIYNMLSTTVHAELLASVADAGSPQRRCALAEEIWEFCRSALVVAGI